MPNSIEHFLPNPESRQRLRAGPLARDIDGFATWLAPEGYARSSVRAKLQFIADLSRCVVFQFVSVDFTKLFHELVRPLFELVHYCRRE